MVNMLIRSLFTLITALSLIFGLAEPNLVKSTPRMRSISVQQAPENFSVEFFPVSPYYVGDLISIRVTYSGSLEIGGTEIKVTMADNPVFLEETTTFSEYSQEAVFYWVLDTGSFDPGFVRFRFDIAGLDEAWVQGINLLPPVEERDFAWENVQTDCCKVYYLTNTDAAADIEAIQKTVQIQVEEALSWFSASNVPGDLALEEPLSLVLIPIVIGHGGFATNVAVITYSHNNWAGGDFAMLVKHEAVHVIDRTLNEEGPRPSLLAEGLAVYISGGHYRPSDLIEKAAGLRESSMYIPIVDMVDDFYNAQHEISYIEAGALVSYLVDKWGWEEYINFYFGLKADDPDPDVIHFGSEVGSSDSGMIAGSSDSEVIERALEQKTGMTLVELEAEFTAYLDSRSPSYEAIEEMQLTVKVYDALRRYEKLVIPSAHFQSAWWPPIRRMQESGITGDYALREKSPFNVIIENLFLTVHHGLDAENYAVVDENLQMITHYLDLIEESKVPISHYSIGWPLPHIHNQPIRP